MDSDTQLFNMPNNIDMSNDLDIWWDRDAQNKAENDLRLRMNLFCFCLVIVFIKIKEQ